MITSKFSALCFESGQQCKHVLALKFHNLLQAIELGILRCLIHRKLACINPQHAFCPCNACIQRKGACMGKAVQHIHSLTNFMNGQSIILLVKEKAGFLPFLHINDIFTPFSTICTLVSKGSLRKPFQGCMPSCLRTFASLRSYTPRIWMPSSSIASMSSAESVSFMRSTPSQETVPQAHRRIYPQPDRAKIRFPENNTAEEISTVRLR